jgi:hypothetical protein
MRHDGHTSVKAPQKKQSRSTPRKSNTRMAAIPGIERCTGADHAAAPVNRSESSAAAMHRAVKTSDNARIKAAVGSTKAVTTARHNSIAEQRALQATAEQILGT